MMSQPKFIPNNLKPSYSQSLRKQQSQPLWPWSAHAPPFGQSPSSFLRNSHALSTSATVAGELFLFGGYLHRSRSPTNDLYVISTQDFSKTLLQTGGDVPSPRFGHSVVLTSTILLIWGGTVDFNDQSAKNQSNDDSLYLLNLVSREWSLIVINGPGPGGRSYHTMTLVGSKLFVFGGRTDSDMMRYNDIWALDSRCLRSNPCWESYEPAAGNKKPAPRAGHVAITTGDRIIIFGGYDGTDNLNDTWSFYISTRKWIELQCTGSIPSPRTSHAAVLIDNVMYVYGGGTVGGTILGGLFAFNLSTHRWTAFQDIGPSPCGRWAHAMASDGRRVFMFGGSLSYGAQADDVKPIHVLDTKLLVYPKPDSASPQITQERDLSSNGLPLRPTGVSGRPNRVPEEGDDGEGATEYHAKLATPGTPPGNEIARLEDGHLLELERQLSETLVAKTERDRRIAQLTDELALKNALLEQAAEEKEHAGLGKREVQAKLDELILFRDQALEQAQSALQKATFRADETNERGQPACEHDTELAEVRAELEAVRLRLTDAEDGLAKSKVEADTLRAQAAAGHVNTDVDQVMHRFMERMRAMEAEVSSLRGNEKSIEEMECRNEG